MNKIKYYKVGLELIDKYKRPVEHIAYEEEIDLDTALELYDSWGISETCGKYMIAVMDDDTEYMMKNEGYESIKKYYVEIGDMDNPCEFAIQSQWFDTEELAIVWAKGIKFLDTQYSISLMSSEWDVVEDSYTEIEFVRYLYKELNMGWRD